jgi:catalase
MFFRSLEKPEQAHLASALVFELSKVETAAVRERTVGHLRHIDAALAQRVADGLGMDTLPPTPAAAIKPADMPVAAEVRIIGRMKDTLQGRCVGILFNAGSDAGLISALRNAAEKAGATVKLIAPKLGGAVLSNGKPQPADGQLAGTPSMLFDAVAIVLSAEAGKAMAKDTAAVDFVANAWAHLKAIAADDGAQPLLKAGNVGKDHGVLDASDSKAFIDAAKTRQWGRESKLRVLA